jgi:hypothetical protein
MKLLLLFFLGTVLTMAQIKKCEYEINEKTDTTSFKMLPHKLMIEKIFGTTNEFLFFSLLKNNEVPMISIQLLQKSKDFIPVSCFNKSSKIILQLDNGKIVTFISGNDETCSTLSYDAENQNNIRILTGYFYFTNSNYEELKNSPISLLRLQFMGNNKDYVVKSEIDSETIKLKANPASFFIEFLNCIE